VAYLLWLFYQVSRGSYRGRYAYFRLSQENQGIRGWLVRNFLSSPIRIMFQKWDAYLQMKDEDRVPPFILLHYDGPSVGGYGEIGHIGGKLEGSQRSRIIPLVEEAVGKEKVGGCVEVGTGNGDVLLSLARKFPDVGFTGIDFNVDNANRQPDRPGNVRFVAGYALELLPDLKPDLLYMSSTTVVFTPREVQIYFSMGIPNIVISEPTWAGYDYTQPGSALLEPTMWYHNFPQYLREAGYTILKQDFFHIDMPRPDIHQLLLWALKR
jgi:hypothetical protein